MRRHEKSCPALPCPALIVPSTTLIVPSTAFITPLPDSILPKRLEGNVAANKPEHRPFCSFTLFSTVSVTPFINKTFSHH